MTQYYLTQKPPGYLVGGGVEAVTMIISVFNGIIHAFIAWLIFTLVILATKKDKKEQVTVSVNVNDKSTSPPPPPPQS